MTRLGALIESGAAAEMMKAAGLDIQAPIEAVVDKRTRLDMHTSARTRANHGYDRNDEVDIFRQPAKRRMSGWRDHKPP